MPASYPAAIKTYVDLIDNVDLAEAVTPNSHQDEITAIETELGTDPAGSETDVQSRLDLGPVVKLTNKNGGALADGDVVVADAATNSGAKQTTTQGDTKQVYVAVEAISDNTEGHFQRGGIVSIQVTGAVTRGHYLRTSTTAKKAETTGGSEPVDGSFAVAVESVGGAGLCKVELFGYTQRLRSVTGWTNVEVFTASGTWTRPAGVDKVKVEVWGGGGGGGGGGGTGGSPAAGSAGAQSSFGSDIIGKGGSGGGNGNGVSGAPGAGGTAPVAGTGTIEVRPAGYTGLPGQAVDGTSDSTGGTGGPGGNAGGGGGAGGSGGPGGVEAGGAGGAIGIEPGGGGGGGGGAGKTASAQPGGGGGGGGAAGGYAAGIVTVTGNVTVTIGAGGTGGTAGTSAGAGGAGAKGRCIVWHAV